MSRVSIVVTNFNYEAFLGACIDSALAQDHPNTEVIVVDDGSTDDSAGVIERYGAHITAIFQPNGGQGSAFNSGFARSTGDVVIFLDADDLLDVEAASAAAAMIRTPGVVKAHWPLREIDGAGAETGRLVPGRGLDLSEGDLRDEVVLHGPATMRFPPTSGNAWARGFLEQVLPMDEDVFRIGPTPCCSSSPRSWVPWPAMSSPGGAIARMSRTSGGHFRFGPRLSMNTGFTTNVCEWRNSSVPRIRTAGSTPERGGAGVGGHDLIEPRRRSRRPSPTERRSC